MAENEKSNEKRLIDADALIAEYDRVHIGPPGGARKLMEDAPTVDAVPVVRCKDCKHYDDHTGKCYVFCEGQYHTELEVDSDHFCSYGERRKGE